MSWGIVVSTGVPYEECSALDAVILGSRPITLQLSPSFYAITSQIKNIVATEPLGKKIKMSQ